MTLQKNNEFRIKEGKGHQTQGTCQSQEKKKKKKKKKERPWLEQGTWDGCAKCVGKLAQLCGYSSFQNKLRTTERNDIPT